MTSKTWRRLVVAYLAFYVVAIAIERHGLDRGPMSAMEKILTAPILGGFAVDAVNGGSALGRFFWIDRSEKPFGFWAIVTFEFLFGLFLLGWGIRDAVQ